MVRFRSQTVTLLVSLLLAWLTLEMGALAAPGDIILASTNEAGVKGNAHSVDPSLSADSTTVAFVTSATNLDPRDTDSLSDIYAKDLATGMLTLASSSDAGVKGNNASGITPRSLSADGSKLAFASFATNLDPTDTDTLEDIYVKDLTTGEITLASTSDTGVKGNGGSLFAFFEPSISGDGKKVAFATSATNLDPGDTDRLEDIYVKDLTTGDITLASTSNTDVKANGRSFHANITPDGTRVAFFSEATNLDPTDTDAVVDVYVKDLVTGNLTLASITDAGVKGNDRSFGLSVSSDGDRVAFTTFATNLHPADTDSLSDVYVKDLSTGDLTLASTSDTGSKGNSSNAQPSLSADGNEVAFMSFATNFDPNDTDGAADVYVKDLVSGGITLASTTAAGVKANNHPIGFRLSLSADGTVVAWPSFATNLDPADTDTLLDIYVKELGDAAHQADLSLNKSDSPDPVTAGKGLSYRIKVSNHGPDTATGVTMTDELPGGVSFRSAQASQGSCAEAGGIVTCDLGILMNGRSARITLRVRPTQPGTITNTANVSANEADPNSANNQDTAGTSVD